VPGIFDNSTVSQVQQANDIVDVISEHLRLAKKGKEMVGLCPFHDDHRPSLTVNPAKQIFKCFACGAGGDVLKFVQLRENLSFGQAIERLAERAGIRIEQKQRAKDGTQASRQADAKDLARINAWALKFWRNNLEDERRGSFAREYIRGRQISDESVKNWALGLATDSWQELVDAGVSAKIPFKLLELAGLVNARDNGEGFYDKFRNRLMFPITDVTGRIIGFGGRNLASDGAKYINSPTTVLFDKSRCLYGLQQSRHEIVSSGTAVVVEGYTDCIMAHQFGCQNVVATLGTSFTAGHARILRRYAEKVVLVFDSDTAGIAAANRALEICLAERIDIKVASVPKGKDPCDFLLSAGKEAFDELVAGAIDVMKFKWDRLTADFNNGGVFADKRAAIEEFLRVVAIAMSAGNLDPIDRGLVVNQLSSIIGLDSRQINAELARIVKKLGNSINRSVKNQETINNVDTGEGFYAAAQREVLEVLLNEPKLLDTARQRITVEAFDVPIFNQIATVLFELPSHVLTISLKEILSKIESVEAGKVLTELADAGEQKGNFEVRLHDALCVMVEERKRYATEHSESVNDETDSLRQFQDTIAKENLRNAGMI